MANLFMAYAFALLSFEYCRIERDYVTAAVLLVVSLVCVYFAVKHQANVIKRLLVASLKIVGLVGVHYLIRQLVIALICIGVRDFLDVKITRELIYLVDSTVLGLECFAIYVYTMKTLLLSNDLVDGPVVQPFQLGNSGNTIYIYGNQYVTNTVHGNHNCLSANSAVNNVNSVGTSTPAMPSAAAEPGNQNPPSADANHNNANSAGTSTPAMPSAAAAEIGSNICHHQPTCRADQAKSGYLVRTPLGCGSYSKVLENAEGDDAAVHHPATRAMPENLVKRWVDQIVSAVTLRYMHELGLAHQDLKLESIRLSSTDLKTIQICDFGFVGRIQHSAHEDPSGTSSGSKAYAAPEILQGRAYDPKKAKVWALGVIIYIVVTGKMPFDETKGTKNVVEGQRMLELKWLLHRKPSVACQSLVRRAFTWNCRYRPTTLRAAIGSATGAEAEPVET